MTRNMRLKCTAHLMRTNALCGASFRRGKLSAAVKKRPTLANVVRVWAISRINSDRLTPLRISGGAARFICSCVLPRRHL